jgi:phosphoglycolate phosphatase
MENSENILFDLDGTLTDSRPGIINSILYSLSRLGIQEPNPAELYSFLGQPLKESFQKRYQFPESIAELAVEYYQEYYSVKGNLENEIFPGILDFLDFLATVPGRRLFVATSKPEVLAKSMMRHLKFDQYFTDAVGSNINKTRTDKAEIIAFLMTAYQLSPESTIMIGDRKHDLIGARKNGIRSIAVRYGYGSALELTDAGPDFFAKDPADLKLLFS